MNGTASAGSRPPLAARPSAALRSALRRRRSPPMPPALFPLADTTSATTRSRSAAVRRPGRAKIAKRSRNCSRASASPGRATTVRTAPGARPAKPAISTAGSCTAGRDPGGPQRRASRARRSTRRCSVRVSGGRRRPRADWSPVRAAPRWRRWPHLHLPRAAARSTARPQARQAARAVSLPYESREVEIGPATARRAPGGQPVTVLKECGQGVERGANLSRSALRLAMVTHW
jgi:hypothetical protein